MIGNPGNAAVFTMRHPLPHSKIFSASQEKSAGGKRYLHRLPPYEINPPKSVYPAKARCIFPILRRGLI